MYGKQEQTMIFNAQETQNEPWRELDDVIRKWVTLSGWEKDLVDYENRKDLQEMKDYYSPRYQD